MKRKTIIWIVVTSVVVIGVLIYFSIDNKPNRYRWDEDYKTENDQPYGTQVIREMLDGYFSDKKNEVILEKEDLTHVLTNTNKSIYVFVGDEWYITFSQVNKLLNFVERGNQVFISTNRINTLLINKMEDDNERWKGFNSTYKRDAALNFSDARLKTEDPFIFNFVIKDQKYSYSWNYIPSIDLDYEILGTVDDQTNFIRIKYGKGYVYLHSNPICFSNYHLINTYGFEYSSRVFSYLEKGNIYWDEYSKTNPYDFDTPESRDRKVTKSPLSYFLSKKSFRWAWYLLVVLVVLFLLFRSKRRQQIVPVINPNTDTSLLFAQTVGRLYYIQNDHKRLAGHQIKHFLIFIRNRYRISTKKLDDSFVNQLVDKSEVDEAVIRKIVQSIDGIEKLNTYSMEGLMSFHQLLNTFYSNCK